MIIEKSKELFFSRGFKNVLIQDICDAVEYGRSAVYKLFESKEEIYGYIYVEATKILADLIAEVDTSNFDSRKTFSVFTKQIYRFLSEYQSYFTTLSYFDFNHQAFNRIPEYLKKKKYAEKERALSYVRKILDRGIKDGLLLNFDIDQIINVYFSSVLGIINMFLIEKKGMELEQLEFILNEHACIYERGLSNK